MSISLGFWERWRTGRNDSLADSVSASFTVAHAAVSQPPVSRSTLVCRARAGLRRAACAQHLQNARGRTCVRPLNSPEVGSIAVVAVPLLQRVTVVIAV
jgi:hypothetical protein